MTAVPLDVDAHGGADRSFSNWNLWNGGRCSRQAASTANSTLPDLVNSALITSTAVSDWGGTLEVEGRVKNQGGSTTTAPFEIEIYVNSIRGYNKYAVPVGLVTIPSGLAAGQSVPYDTSITLPTAPIPDVSSDGGTLYVNAVVNPTQSVAESNYHNNEDLGPPYDSAPVAIQTPTPANLVGTTLAVTPTDPTWGSTITVTAQITNQSSGASPQTRALLSITPQGLTYGGSTSFGIGSLAVPALAAYQTVNLVQSFTLPAVSAIDGRRLHQLWTDDDPGRRLSHQQSLPPPARSRDRPRPDSAHDHD